MLQIDPQELLTFLNKNSGNDITLETFSRTDSDGKNETRFVFRAAKGAVWVDALYLLLVK